jgi:hypothetical protein
MSETVDRIPKPIEWNNSKIPSISELKQQAASLITVCLTGEKVRAAQQE